MRTVKEKSRELEIIGNYDVVVVGGGPGGITAAIASARNGAKTLIVERYGFFGGLATGGLMGPLFGYAEITIKDISDIWSKRRGGELILGGLPVEIVGKLQSYGAAPPNEELTWEAIRFDPEIMKHVLDAMALEAGADILFHTLAVNVSMNKNSIDYLILENKSGRQAAKAKIFVDATGDGDVAYFAGAEYTKGRKADGATQSIGTKVIIGGVEQVSDKEKKKGYDRGMKAIDEKKIPIYHPFLGEVSERGVTLRENEVSPTVTRIRGDGTNARDLTKAELKLRKDILETLKFYRENVPGFARAYLRATPMQVGVRETRQIIGTKILKGQDILSGRKGLSDAVARGCWFLDIHCPLGLTASGSWLCDKRCKVKPECIMMRKYRDQLPDSALSPRPIGYYDIPYGCLVPKTVDNLLVSGRCISADHWAMSSARVIGTCFAIGEAVGTAAAMSVAERVRPKGLDVSGLRSQLRKQDVLL